VSKMTDDKKWTYIRVSKKLANKLRELGKMGDTYEDVIWRLIEKAEGKGGTK